MAARHLAQSSRSIAKAIYSHMFLQAQALFILFYFGLFCFNEFSQLLIF